VLAQDETDLLLFPPLRAGGAPRGAPAKVWLAGGNARRVVFGAMNLVTGTRLLVPRPKGRSIDFQACLDEVRCHYWGRHVALLVDEDPSRTAKASLKASQGITLLWPPKRSPELNPMDTLWGQGKDVVSADKQDGTIEEHGDRFLKYLYGLSNREALQTSGVLSDDFWLRRTLSKKFPSAHALVRQGGGRASLSAGRGRFRPPGLAHQGMGARKSFAVLLSPPAGNL
jgi:hypothetical protein